jgi:hypothetical protein
LYILNTQLCLHFLHRTGFVNSAPIEPIERYIEKHRKRYLRYYRQYNDETKESPWLGTDEPESKDENEIISSDDMEALITKKKDD